MGKRFREVGKRDKSIRRNSRRYQGNNLLTNQKLSMSIKEYDLSIIEKWTIEELDGCIMYCKMVMIEAKEKGNSCLYEVFQKLGNIIAWEIEKRARKGQKNENEGV